MCESVDGTERELPFDSLWYPANQEVTQASDPITTIIKAARAVDRPSTFALILQAVARSVRAFACVLWEVSQDADLESDPPQGDFYVLVPWFANPKIDCSSETMPIQGSLTGKAVRMRTVETADDVKDGAAGTYWELNFFREANIGSVAVTRVDFLDGAVGALKVYRVGNDPFTDAQLRTLVQAATLIPSEYQRVRQELTLNTLRRVEDVIRARERGTCQ